MSRLATAVAATPRRHRDPALFVALVALSAAFLASSAPRAAATVTAISEGQLEWGVKESWRKYISLDSKVGDGAEVTEWLGQDTDKPYPASFTFPVVSGSFDDATNTTILQLGGYLHFQSWYEVVAPGKYALDTKFSDLELEISPTAQVLRGDHTGYLRTDPGGELHVDDDVVLTKFDVSGATTSFEGGTSKWGEIPTVAGPGLSLYTESTVLEPTSLEYTGPGGTPDLDEHWDWPGSPGLKPEGTWLSDPASAARSLHPSEQNEIVHTVDLVAPETSEAKLVLAAHDAATLAPVGTPTTWPLPGWVGGEPRALRTAFDAATDSVFFVTYGDGVGSDEATVRRAVWEEGEGYAVETVGSLGSAPYYAHKVPALVWNPVVGELAAIGYLGPEADPYATDLLHRFQLESGAWTHQQTVLRAPDTGVWAGASSVYSPWEATAFQADEKTLAVARDGSYVSASATGSSQGHYYPALHISVGEDGSATVAPIAGTTTPRTAIGTYYGFLSLTEDVDGSLLLHNSSQVMDAYVRIDVADGVAATVGEIVDAPSDLFPPYELSAFANSMAADPARGIVWATDPYDPNGYRLNALDGDEFVGRYAYSDFPVGGSNGAFGRLAIGPDGAVYLPIQDPESSRLGYRRLAYTGTVPEVTTQPQDRAVTLGVGEASEAAQFSVAIAAAGDSIQWQRRAPGETVFADVAGATATTLSVEATPVAHGTEYRARVSNGAGKVVSETAELSVEYAPQVVSGLANRSVTEGADAVFLLSAAGNPEPTVTWQRRAGGYWQDIAPADENFVVNGPALTVLETNLEQSGSVFRAKLTNSVASVLSNTVKLTVTPKVGIPPEGLALENVSLEWTGSAEMQKVPFFGNSNFFSAGASDGKEASYDAFADNAAVYQVSSAGTETIATWATRAAHVSGASTQLVRLYGGDGKIEPDGAASVVWDGSWSVNFYGGLVPFTFSDPELLIDADGIGTFVADMSGCESSKVNPNQCTPFGTVADVTVATFSGAEVDPAGAVTIEPDYAGVETTVPPSAVPQNRTAAGWGAWPQPFVDFQVKTGLSSHWYSSGGAFDPDKAPRPFVVDFDGEALPPEPDPGPAPQPQPQPKPPVGGSVPAAEVARIATGRKARVVGGNRVATIATITCAGEGFCAVLAPKRVKLKIAGKAYWAKVIAPAILAGGSERPVKVKLSKAALEKLGGRTAKGQISVSVRSQVGAMSQTIAVRIKKGG